MKEKLKKDLVESFDMLGTVVITPNENVYKHIPHWFKATEELMVYEVCDPDNLPADLVEAMETMKSANEEPRNQQNLLQQIVDQFPDEGLLKVDGFDDAVIGIDTNNMRLIYSVEKCLNILQESMTREDALEYFGFKVSGSYLGEKTPIWCWDNFD